MIVTLKTQRPGTVEQVRRFPDGAGGPDVQVVERAAACDFIAGPLSRLGHARWSRADEATFAKS